MLPNTFFAKVTGGSEQRKPAELSAGHRHGVATGRAIVGGGQLLLMDEPLAHLDSRMRLRVRTELRQRKAAEEATILYATNDQEEAMALADRIAVLHEGRVRQVGTPRQVLQLVIPGAGPRRVQGEDLHHEKEF